MIIKTENKNPVTTFLTSQGNRTPKEIWLDTETGNKDITKKGVIAKVEMWKRLGITADMTDDEVMEKVQKRLAAN